MQGSEMLLSPGLGGASSKNLPSHAANIEYNRTDSRWAGYASVYLTGSYQPVA